MTYCDTLMIRIGFFKYFNIILVCLEISYYQVTREERESMRYFLFVFKLSVSTPRSHPLKSFSLNID